MNTNNTEPNFDENALGADLPDAAGAVLRTAFDAETAACDDPALRARILAATTGNAGSTGSAAVPRARSTLAAAGRPARPNTRNIIPFVFGGLAAAGIAAAFVLAPRQTTSVPTPAPRETAAVTGETRVRPAAGGVAFAPDTRLAADIARLPALNPGGGANAPVETRRRPRAPVALTAGSGYVGHLRAALAAGRLPDRRLVRVDGIVNDLLAATASELRAPVAAGGVSVELEAVPAPWTPHADAARTAVVRVTVRTRAGTTGGVDGADAVVAANVRGALEFDPARVRSWRVLGHEDAPAGAPALDAPATLLAGTAVTTLYEIRLAGAGTGAAAARRPLATFRFAGGALGGRAWTLDGVAAWDGASDDTRFAVAAAALALAMRESTGAGGVAGGAAAFERAGRLAAGARNPNKPLFDALLRDALAARAGGAGL